MAKKPTYKELEQRVKELERMAFEHRQAEKLLSHEKNFSESIIDSLPGVFYFFDNKGKFLRWNKNLEEITGYSAEEVGKMNPLEFFIEEDKRNVGEKIQEVFDTGRSSVEASIVSKSGNIIPFYFTGLRLIVDNRSYLVGMGIDISERKQSEAALREAHEKLYNFSQELENKVQERTQELGANTQRSRRSLKGRSRIRRLVHDRRSQHRRERHDHEG